MKGITLLAIVLLSSCTTGIGLRSVKYTSLFNDYNSKVWVINQMKVGNAVISPEETYEKHVMIFHYDLTVDYIAMKDIAEKPPKKGAYYVDSDEKKITIDFDKESWLFDLAYLTEDSIVMVPTKKSDFEASIQLKPFPKL